MGDPRPIPSPRPRSWKSVSYVSPDGVWTLGFSDPDEFAMGATYWKSELVKKTGSKRVLPPAMGVDALEPFSFDSRLVAYQKVHLGGTPLLSLLLAEVGGWSVRATPALETFVSSVRWSPNRLLLLVLTQEHVKILDADGRERISVPTRIAWHDGPTVGWTPSGEHFFVLGREGGANGDSISFWSLEGRAVAQEGLDPAVLVPYDSSPYEGLSRDKYALGVGDGLVGVARMLQSWNESAYNSRTGELALCVHRPKEDAARNVNSAVGVEPHWVVVPIVDD